MAPKNTPINKNLVRAVIFDLDDTLFDTYGQLVKPASREACEAMIRAGLKTKIDECVMAREKLFTANPRKNIYEQLVEHFGLNENVNKKDVIQAGFNAFHDRHINEEISLFSDALEIIKALGEKFELYLVTLGTPSTQQKKIELLGLEEYLKKIYIVNINNSKTKFTTFHEILTTSKHEPRGFVSIGNRIDSEIRDAKELGMQTILMLHGEYVQLQPQTSFEEPDAKVETLSQLREILL
ncbi:MAG: HAD family hydrolase [Oligoflexia bacterium]|nr:HAD family hydrolase [Oligoflexia bacterium]